jgi:xylulokinase
LSREYVIGFDSGTQSVKTIIFGKNGDVVGEGHQQHQVHLSPGRAEQNPEDWWRCFCLSTKQALSSAKISSTSIGSIGITHQRCTLCIVDEACHPLLPAQVWYDARSVQQVRWIREKFGAKKYLEIAGRLPDTTWWAQKVMWVKDNLPEIFDRAYKFLTVHGYFVQRMTGEWKDSYAAPTGLLDMAELRYSQTLLEQFGIPREKLCDLTPPAEVIGYVTERAAEETGLPSGLPVASGAGDQQAGGLGCGVTESRLAYLNLGTSVVLGTVSPRYIAHPDFLVREGVIPGTWNPEALLNSGYWLIAWFKENFAKQLTENSEKTGTVAEEALDALADKIPAGSLGLVVQPYWLGVRQPYWDENARGSVIGWTSAHKLEHLYRAILEGISYDTRLNLEGMEKVLDLEVEEVRVHGGGAKSKLSCQIAADVLNRDVNTVSTAEATALGAAILAATAVGFYPNVRDAAKNMVQVKSCYRPIRSNSDCYSKLFRKVYSKYYESVRLFFSDIAEIIGYA